MPTLYTADEAISVLRAAPKSAQFAVMLALDAPFRDQPGAVFRGALKHHVTFNRAEAIRLIAGLQNPSLEALGGRIPLDVRALNGGPAVCYWIGG